MKAINKHLMNTPDLHQERLDKLKKLFPDLFTVEGKLNPDELKKIIDPDLVKETERFEFKWFGKSAAKRNAFTPGKETLKKLEPFKDNIFICLERALDTTMKWNLKHLLGDKLIAF
jgi:hypothetical protein